MSMALHMTPSSTHIAGVRVDAQSIHDAVERIQQATMLSERAFLTTFVNPGCISFATQSPSYRSDLLNFDLVLPDGIALAKILNWRGKKAERISFDSTSLAPHVFKTAEQRGKTMIFVGGRPGVASRAAQTVSEEFPDLRILHTFNGFDDLDKAANFAIEKAINIVVCSMGCGAQERFLLRLKTMGWIGCGFTCGGYFDQLSEDIRYYPEWIDRHNLRWAYRLYKEPRRLWRRYLFQYGLFGLLLLKNWAIWPARESNLNPLPSQVSHKAGAVHGMQDSRS